MIVISGALVLVALVLLVIGLIGPSLGFVYASIGASLAAFAFLVVGILQRRKAEPDLAAGAPASAEELAAVIRTPETASSTVVTEELAAPAPAVVEDHAPAGAVLVVEGRPRYHVAGCRYLAGKVPSELELSEARAQGFTACGVCKPDATLAAASAAVQEVAPEPVDEGVTILDEPVAGPAAETAPEPVAAPAAKASRSATKVAKAAPAKAATTANRAVKAPAKAAKAAPAKVAPTKAAPAKVAPTKAAPTKAAPTRASAGKVVVVPNRDKFHTASCRFVQGVEGAKEITRATAARQGYSPCGVCKP